MKFLQRSTKRPDDKDKKPVNVDNPDIYRDSRLTCGGRLSEEFIESLRKQDPKQSEQKKDSGGL